MRPTELIANAYRDAETNHVSMAEPFKYACAFEYHFYYAILYALTAPVWPPVGLFIDSKLDIQGHRLRARLA